MLPFLASGVVGTSWLAHCESVDNRVPASDTVSRLELELRQTSSLHCNFSWNSFILFQAWLKRESENKIKREPEQTAAAELFPNKAHATANVSLLALYQKLPTATSMFFVQAMKIR